MRSSYLTSGQIVSPSLRRIRILSHFLDRKALEETAQDVARRYGISRAALYQLAARGGVSLLPHRPGPQPGARENERLHSIICSQAAIIAGQRAEG